jgi:hypothetical protein
MNDVVQSQFSGLVVGSADPDRLSAWYRAAFAPDDEPGDILGRPVIMVGDARLLFDKRDDVAVRAAEPGRVLVNLFVTDVDAARSHLDTLGVTWIRPVETVAGFGSIGTFEDPDGNYVQLLYRAG